MNSPQRLSLFLLRISIGWFFLYAGLTKVFDTTWSAAGYLGNAKTFPDVYSWLLQPEILPVVNILNEWGLTLIGASLILGIGVRISGILGALMMVLYYFPILQFPNPTPYTFLIDDHIVFAFALLMLAVFRAGRAYGLETYCAQLPLCKRFPALRALIG